MTTDTTRTAPSALSSSIRNVVFIDSSVPDAQALAASVQSDTRVVWLDASADGVEQIAAVLRQYEDLDSVQIVSHGAEGAIRLGSTLLDRTAVDTYRDALKDWGTALGADGDLLLYGCDVAAGGRGQAFIDALALATGADVAASTDTTGSLLLGADWDLERSTGSIEAASALGAQAQLDYAHTLPLVNNGAAGTINFSTSSNVTLINTTGLGAGAVVNAANILGTGLDLYARSSNGGGISAVNVNGAGLAGIPLSDDRLTVNGSLLSPVSYVDLRANSGVFDMVSLKLGSGSLVGNLLGTVVFTVYALDANYQPTGVGVSLTSLLVNEYGLLNFASMANFKGIYGVRIVNPLGFEVAIDDVQVANGRATPSVTSAAYNAGTGTLTISAANLVNGEPIDPTKITLSGQGGSYTLTTAVAAAAGTSSVEITLNAADKQALSGLLNKAGTSAVDGTTFNLAAAASWVTNTSAPVDLTGNPITVGNLLLPTITSATYDSSTHVLTVTGSNLVSMPGAGNDITVSKLVLRGEGGATRTLSTTGNVEVTSATSFSVTLSGADVAAVAALLNKSGAASAGGTTYQLSAGDDWNSVVGNADTSVAGAAVVVTNAANAAPTITGTATASTGDNAAITPFSGVTVADVNGDNVSLAIGFNGANGTLSGAGLSGSNGSYTLSAATPAALTAQLRALTFTPTANQAAVGVNVATTFSLTATDSNGAASAANTATVVTATSVNDAPVLGGTAAAQSVTAGGTLHPFSGVTLSDPDVGASVIVTITLDSASKGAFTAASLSASGFSTSDGGLSYSHAATAPGAAQAALQALVFQAAAGQNATTTFTVSINDGSTIVNNSATTVVAATPSSTTAVTVAFSADTGVSATDLVTNVAAQTISGTLSSGLASGERVEVSLDNGTTWTTATAAVGATTWQLAGQTLSGTGTLQVRVANAGGSSAPLTKNYALDTTAPTTTGGSVAFSGDSGASGSDLVTNVAAQTISGTLGANLAAGEHVEVSLNNGSTWTTASASVGSNAWSLAGQTLTGSGTLQVRVVDAAGNAGTAAGNAFVLDTTAPTASLSSNTSTLKSGELALVTVTFSEAPSGFALGDLSAVGGTLGNLKATADPHIYTVELTPGAGQSGVQGGVSLTAGSYTDLAGNSGGGAASGTITISTVGPSVLITSDVGTLKSGETANISFTFSSAPTGFTASDVVATGGSISGLTSTGNPLVYTAVFTPAADVSAAASITVTGGSYTDAASLPGGAGATPVIQIDTRAPTVAITSSTPALKIGETATISFTFSEVPVGFTAADVTVTGGSLSGLAVTGDPLVYTGVFTPTAGVPNGTASITVAAGSYTDTIGNSGQAGTTPAISIGTLAPTTTGATVAFSADSGASSSDLVTNIATQNLSGSLSAALATGEVVQVSLDNGSTWVNASASAGSTSWALAGATLAGNNTLQVRVGDAAGNHGPAFSALYVLDTTAPSVAVASNVAAVNAGQTATLTFTFSEAPSNFTTSSLSVTGGSVSGITATANPLVYTATFTPTIGQAGVTASIAVNSAGFTDSAGNNGQASTPATIAVNTTAPTLAITSNDSTLTAGETALITFTFSAPPTGFTAADVTYANGTLSGFTVTSDPMVYTASFTPTAGLANASATIGVGNGTYTDVFGNSGSGATSLPIAIDTVALTVDITSSTPAVKADETALITFTFSKPPIDFTSSDVLTTGGTLSGLAVTGNPLVYTATFTPTPGIQNISAGISIAAGAFTDAAGNTSAAAQTPALAIDTRAPTAAASTVVFSNDNGASPTDLVTSSASQTITGTLAAAPGSGEYVEVSLDGGMNWTTANLVGTAWTLAGHNLLPGNNVLQVRVTDAAGNHGPTLSQAYVLDTTSPTAAVSANTPALKAGETALITFTFNEAPLGFAIGDLSASGGTLSSFAATANPLVYTVVFTPNTGVSGGSGVVTLNAGSYTDSAGNSGLAASLPAISVDTLVPTTGGATVAFSSDSGSTTDLVTNVAAQTISGTLSANLAAGETVQVSLDSGTTWILATSLAGSNGWTLTGQTLTPGTGQQVQVRVSDSAGNHGPATGFAYTLDQSTPTLQISSSKSTLNSAETALITFTFSEAPAGFSAASVSASGGILSGLVATANPLVYTAVFTPTAGQAAGTGTVTVAAGAYTDIAGNLGGAAAVPAISYATVAPGISITSDVGMLKAGQTASITFRFSSAPTGFATNDIVVGGGTLSGFGVTADPLVYTALFTPGAGVTQDSGTISVASGLFTDSLGNPGVGGSLVPITIDTVAPTLAITSSVSSLNASATALITFTFSEAPASFTLGDISATNGSLGNLVQTANPLVYTAVLTPAPNVASGTAVVSVAAGAFADLVGNAGVAAMGPSIDIDTQAPSVVSGSLQFSADTGSSSTDLITRTATQTIAGTLSGGTLGAGEVVEVSLDNGSTWQAASAPAGGTSWSLADQTLVAGSGNVQVRVRVSDNASNHGPITNYTYVLDTTAPTVTMASDASSLRAGQSATITFTFTEAPAGFTLGDLIATGGTLSGFTATANPLVYTVVLTPTPGFGGNASVTLGNGLYADAAGNAGTGGQVTGIGVDTQAPTLAITSNASTLGVGQSATITFTFSDVPTGFTLGDVTATNGTLSNLVASADQLVYTATFTPAAGVAGANAQVSVAAGLYLDAAGNAGAAVSSPPIAVNTVAPTTSGASVSFSADYGASSTDLVTNAATQVVSGTLDAPLTAGQHVEVSLNNGGTWLTAQTASPTQWTLAPQSLSGSGSVQVRVVDTANNAGPVFSAGFVLDLLAPTMAVTSSATELKAGDSATLTFTFSEAPSGFTVGDLVAVNGTLSGFTPTANPLVYTVVLTPTAGLSGASASVTLAQGMYTDLAGNAGSAVSSPLITVDTMAPSLQITSSAASLRVGEQATISFTFSEAPSGFGIGDVSVTGGVLSGFGQTANPLVYTAIFTPTAGSSGSATISVASGAYFDAAGNPGPAAAVTPIAYSTQAPTTTGATVVFSADTGIAGDLITSTALQTITGTLSANLVAGESVQVSLDNGSTWIGATAVAGSNAWALAPRTLTGSGTLQVRVTDAAGNIGPASSSLYALDTTAPGVSITSNPTALKAGDSATLTFTFTEAPQGFTQADLALTGGTISGFGVTANPLVYSALFTPTAGFNGASGVTLAAGAFTDAAGNAGPGASSPTITIDAQAPTLAITSDKTQIGMGDTALITFTFSEAPVGFAVGDVAVTGGTLSGFTVTSNQLVYTAVFTPTPGTASGSASITVAPGLYSDAAGNGGGTDTLSGISFNTLSPVAAPVGTPTFSNDNGASNTDLITSIAAQTVSGNLSQSLAAGESVEVSFDDGANWMPAATIGTTWSLGHTLTGSGVLRVRVVDGGGFHSPETANAYAYQQTTPTVTITSNVTTASSVAPAVITFAFSEAPSGFTASDIAFTGGTLGPLTATSDPKIYTATFTPTAGVASGNATISVTGAYTDLAGNAGASGSIPSLQVDTVAPVTTANGGVQFSNDGGTSTSDLVTNNPSQALSGTLSAPLAADELVNVSVDNGTSWNTANVSGTTWTMPGLSLQSGTHSLRVRVADLAGNFSTEHTQTYTLDTTAPTVTITSNSSTVAPGQSVTVTFTLSDPGVLSLGDIAVTGGTLGNFSGSGTTYTATLTPLANSTTPINVTVAANLLTDAAGNTSAAATPLVVAVGSSPSPGGGGGGGGGGGTPSTVDGVPITTAPGESGATVLTVPVVEPGRVDTPGTSTLLADIPIVKAADGHPILSVSVPTGVGLKAEGLGSATSGAAALAELGLRIERVSGANGQLTNAGKVFYASMAPGEALTVHVITPTAGAGFNPNVPLVINGSAFSGDGKQAVIIDARALPSGATIRVDNVDFIAVAGKVRLTGGAGQNFASGDDEDQWIVLVPDDDVIHGSGGQDIIGSEGGDDQVFGDAGDDVVFGGDGNDLISGGSGSDRLNGGTGFDVALQEGKRSDYTAVLDGAGIRLTHTASGVSDWLVDIEQVHFDTGPILTVAHSAAEEAVAYLAAKWVGRDLTQSEGAYVQTLAGKSALEVATMFANFFPQLAAGRTPAQLLEGMASAGAIRVDAVREETVTGDAGDNTIHPIMGLARYVDGGAGIDTVVFPATLANTYVLANPGGSFTLQRLTEGSMLDLTHVERVTFNDTRLALDVAGNGHAGQAAKLVGALANPSLLANKGLMGEAIRLLDAGVSTQQLAGLGLQILGLQTPAQVAQLLWTNLVGRAGTAQEIKGITDYVELNSLTNNDLVVLASNLDLNATRIDLVGLASRGIEFA